MEFQIGIKSTYLGLCQGVVTVFFGNKSPAPLQAVTCTYGPPSDLLHLSPQPLAPRIGPKQQLSQLLELNCSGPFTAAPALNLKYLLPDNTPRQVTATLPVVITKFMGGRDLPGGAAEFFRLWKDRNFQLSETSAVVVLSPRLSSSVVSLVRACTCGGALTLHHGVGDEGSLVLVGQFPSDSPEGVKCATVPEALVLVRLELAPDQPKARLQVRSDYPQVASAVKEVLLTLLKGE